MQAPFRIWGDRHVDQASRRQMSDACSLPVAVRGALMPDAHIGYGLPIGGVLATENAVIPYAVGVDIACRVMLTVFDLPATVIERHREDLQQALLQETNFGIGGSFDRPRRHAVLDDDWSCSPVTAKHKDKARSQLGTSGSGNHFAEFGVVELAGDETPRLGLLTHSGSRGTGYAVADHYSKLAAKLHPELEGELRRLAWLDLDSEPGQEYWAAMQLMGRYASANHHCIHRAIIRRLGFAVHEQIENHHNFAWLEEHDGRQVVVHRKGATPAGEGVLGVIPGTMAHPSHIVRGKGSLASLDSAAHGAGRAMSRRQAKRQLEWRAVRQRLVDAGVELLSAGLDEAPQAYKDIGEVMAAQTDLVETIGHFHPRIVRMAKAGERPED